jgi:multicomponent Na+:H+ antiporter subunit F
VAFARFVLRQGMEADEPAAGGESPARKGVRQGKATRARRRR